jgi:hypothetical protein
MSPKELGAELLPSLGPDVKLQAHNWLLMGSWLMKPYPRGSGEIGDLQQPIREALQALEHAGLVLLRVTGTNSGGAGQRIELTRLGEEAIASGDIAKYLDVDPAPSDGF